MPSLHAAIKRRFTVGYNSVVQLTFSDWLVVALYFLFNLAIGFYYKSRAGKSVNEFFLSGRNVPWWLAGTSMVATTFAADTPLAVTGMVARGGIAGNWLWWNFVASGMLTVFLYARLWRRSGVMTDIEFSEIRYSGKPAAFLRGFRALYLGIPINCIILGWVNLAMVKILGLVLGVDKLTALLIVLGMIGLTSFISTLSGLWGVLVTDVFQFVIKMGMVTALAVFAVRAVGGMDAMKAKLLAIDQVRLAQGGHGSVLDFVPDLSSAWMPMITFLVYIGMNWWATWYPGAEPGGGGYVAQRMFSAKDEKNSLLATLWFNIAHYAIRPWPWVLVALASLILFPGLADPETGYIRVMIAYLPPSLRGLMVAAFAAAYMSTIATQLNWGASYLVNDFYRRFLKKDGSEKHYVSMSQWATIFLTIVSAVVTFYLESIAGAWKLLLVTGAGTGGVLLLRWYWWRINAWSEVSAMISGFVVSVLMQTVAGLDTDKPVDFAWIMIVTVSVTTVVWLAVTFLTKPESKDTLVAFYRRTHPSAAGWRPIARLAPDVRPSTDGASNLLDWICGCVLIYGVLFGGGKLLLKDFVTGSILMAVGLGAGAFIYWDLSRRGWSAVVD
ncbi:MAG TPA: sodium:solute symporter family protein [Bryobacteraceae bacterium]|nr:sodium:solute symporter family protein [Bryobacteraceae bacterium]